MDFTQAIDQLQKMVNDMVTAVPSVIVALIVFGVFLAVANLTQWVIRKLADRARRRRNVALVVGRLVQWTIIVIGFLVGAVIVFPNFTTAQLIQLLGLSSVAIGFAFRDVLQHLLVGLILLLNEPFSVGDQIIVQDVQGTVEEIGPRATAVRTYDGRRLFIPNTILYNENVTVKTALEKRRIEIDLRLTFDADIDTAKRVILEALDAADHSKVLTGPPPDVLVVDLAEYYVLLRVRWWIHPPLYQIELDTRDQVLTTIKRGLDAAEIALALPAQQILVYDQTGQPARPYVVPVDLAGSDGANNR